MGHTWDQPGLLDLLAWASQAQWALQDIKVLLHTLWPLVASVASTAAQPLSNADHIFHGLSADAEDARCA